MSDITENTIQHQSPTVHMYDCCGDKSTLWLRTSSNFTIEKQYGSNYEKCHRDYEKYIKNNEFNKTNNC